VVRAARHDAPALHRPRVLITLTLPHCLAIRLIPPEGDRHYMAVRTHWTVTHSCTHDVVHDLSDRPADKRAGFARWLTSKDCSVNCTILTSLVTA
jgi:hypothetical protein